MLEQGAGFGDGAPPTSRDTAVFTREVGGEPAAVSAGLAQRFESECDGLVA
ncbi:hypothetical protein [Streptomyces sp. JNUCC 63]